MPKNLKSDWKRIGRSGATVDGRTISPEALKQAAKNYDKKLYSAVINYEHSSWANLGSVDQLRAEENEEGGVDLFAILMPNDLYLSLNKDGQKVHTSMELDFEFRDSGEAYLTGLAATDRPASAATTQVEFSKTQQSSFAASDYHETTTHEFDNDDEPPGWFKRLFTNNNPSSEDIMDKKVETELRGEIADLKQLFSKIMPGDDANTDDGQGEDNGAEQQFATAEDVAALTDKFTALEAKLSGDGGEDKAADLPTQDQFNQLKTGLESLTDKFNKAVGEQPGTNAGEHTGDDKDLSAYV